MGIESSMGAPSKLDRDLSHLQRVLMRIEDPSARKILIMSWWERGEITPEQAELLIRENGLEAA